MVNIYGTVGGVNFALPMETLLGTAYQLLGMNAAANALQYKNAFFNNTTGQFYVPVGAVGVPSLSFDGDLDTGIYSPGADQVAVTIGGVQQLLLDATKALFAGHIQLNQKLIYEDFSSNIVAAATTDMGTATGNTITVTHNAGVLAITSLGGASIPAGTKVKLIFSISGGTVTFTRNATSLETLTGSDVQVVNGDVVEFVKTNDSNAYWRMLDFQHLLNSTTLTTKGDLLAGLGGGATDRLAVGTEGYALVAKAANPQGLGYDVMNKSVSNGYLDLILTNNAVTPNSQLDIDATEVLVKNSSGLIWILPAVNLTLDITASGVNGLDAGGEAANTWYYAYVIYNPTTGVTAGLFSTSPTAPTMPAGYTAKALVGCIRNDAGSNFIGIHQIQNSVWATVNRQIFDGVLATGAWTAIDVSAFFPLAIAKKIHVLAGMGGSTQGISPRSDGHGGHLTTFGIGAGSTYGGIVVSRTGYNIYSINRPVQNTNIYYWTSTAAGTLYAHGWDY